MMPDIKFGGSSALKIKAAGSFKIWYPATQLPGIELSSRSQ